MGAKNPPILGIIVPCYNEEEVLDETGVVLVLVLKDLIKKEKVHNDSFIVFVDDGSRDKTWEHIVALKKQFLNVHGLRMAGNRGHQTALIAGLENFYEEADALISIDADLQDDVAVMEEMIDAYRSGSEIVYGVRSKREHDTFFKKYSALFFYKLMLFLGVNIVYNHADYRLTSRRAVEGLKQYGEDNLFLRGIFPTMGFKSSSVYYERKMRTAGVSKYPFKKMLAFALDGITSFSIKPLRLVMIAGFFIFVVSLFMGAYIVYAHYYLSAIPGWSSLIISIYFLGGVQLFALGIIGEYLGKMYREVKHRPRYFIETKL